MPARLAARRVEQDGVRLLQVGGDERAPHEVARLGRHRQGCGACCRNQRADRGRGTIPGHNAPSAGCQRQGEGAEAAEQFRDAPAGRGHDEAGESRLARRGRLEEGTGRHGDGDAAEARLDRPELCQRHLGRGIGGAPADAAGTGLP